MAGLIVEDGSALETANSYVTQAEADDYWTLRNEESTGWGALSDEAKVAALVQAAQYLDHNYRFIGTRYSSKQMMCWPRGVTGWDEDGRDIEPDEIPQRIKDAQCELAREVGVNGPLLPPSDRGGRVASEAVGPISVTYFADAPSSKDFSFVDTLLADLLEGGMMSRAVLG